MVAGPISVNSSSNPDYPVRYLRRYFRRTGIRIEGRVYAAPKECVSELLRIEYLSHSSPSLRDILWKVNAFSVNDIADRMGRALGGAESMRDYLIQEMGIRPSDILDRKTVRHRTQPHDRACRHSGASIAFTPPCRVTA